MKLVTPFITARVISVRTVLPIIALNTLKVECLRFAVNLNLKFEPLFFGSGNVLANLQACLPLTNYLVVTT